MKIRERHLRDLRISFEESLFLVTLPLILESVGKRMVESFISPFF
jgi:hypothetical protein